MFILDVRGRLEQEVRVSAMKTHWLQFAKLFAYIHLFLSIRVYKGLLSIGTQRTWQVFCFRFQFTYDKTAKKSADTTILSCDVCTIKAFCKAQKLILSKIV